MLTSKREQDNLDVIQFIQILLFLALFEFLCGSEAHPKIPVLLIWKVLNNSL